MRTHVRRLFAQPIALIAAMILAMCSTSCGDSSGGESVFLYVIHGYAGAETMSLIGPGGPIVSGLEFGDRADGEFPIEVDRTLGGSFTLILDGTPQPLEFEKELFSLYPQETATLFISRRSGVASAEATLFRHVQSISRSCLLTFNNSLSLDNNYSTTEFTIYPQFNLQNAATGRFFDESQEQVFTECGPVQTPNPAPIPRQFRGQPIQQAVDADPWFFPVQCPDGLTENILCYYWSPQETNGDPAIVYDGGVALAYPDTATYFQCLEGALTIKQPEDPANPLPFPPADAQVQCPDGQLTWDDINVDGAAVRECAEAQRVDLEGIEPGQQDTYYSIVFPGVTGDSCTIQLRLRTALLDVVFGPNAGEELGRHGPGRGSLIESTITIPLASEHYYVLFGRPVNALLWQWNSGETFADLSGFPYFGVGQDMIGEYNDP